MEIINTNKAPQAIGPYSQATKQGTFLFISGQIALKPNSSEIIGDIKQQTIQVCENIKAIINSAGGDLNNIIKTTIFLKNINNFSVVNEIYGEYFSHKPARSTIEVSNLPKGALIEIESIGNL